MCPPILGDEMQSSRRRVMCNDTTATQLHIPDVVRATVHPPRRWSEQGAKM